jgi:hypothetical protein
MNDYFSLVTTEFYARSRQLRQFIPNHGLSIGTANEVILRDFLQQYLPGWVSVGHGFILDPSGHASKECDILIYRSMLYAPLFRVKDFIVLQPEAVMSVIEVKTSVTKKAFHSALENLIAAKEINPKIITTLFIFAPPRLETIAKYLEDFNFQGVLAKHIPDYIYGLSTFALQSYNCINIDNKKGIGFLDFTPRNQEEGKDAIFEKFYYDLYTKIEIYLNQDLKSGINNIIQLKTDEDSKDNCVMHGRLKYMGMKPADMKLIHFLEVNGEKET